MSAWHTDESRLLGRLNILRLRARLDTTPHTHLIPVAGCYRCELNEQEQQ